MLNVTTCSNSRTTAARFLLVVFLVTATFADSLAAQAVNSPPVSTEIKPLPQPSENKVAVRIVKPREFCQRLTNTLTTLSAQLGLDRRDSQRTGGKASAAIISQLKNGTMMPYLDSQTFKVSAVADHERKWFSLADVLLTSLGDTPKNVLLISDVSELKLTPQAMPGSQLLVLANSVAEMSAERAKNLAMTAQALGIQIHIIWVNSSRDGRDIRAAQGFAFMATLTGGAFLDLSSDGACGQT